MIVLHDDAHLLIFEIIEILWHKDSRFLDFSPQEQTLFLTRNSAVSPLFLRRYSIDAPSILHRWSIVSMEDRWRTDGLSMEYPRSFKEGIAYSLSNLPLQRYFLVSCTIIPERKSNDKRFGIAIRALKMSAKSQTRLRLTTAPR